MAYIHVHKSFLEPSDNDFVTIKIDELGDAIDALDASKKNQKLADEMAGTISDQAEAIKRVRELHKEIDGNTSVCGDPDCCGEYIENYMVCGHCDQDYPCPTIKALDGEQITTDAKPNITVTSYPMLMLSTEKLTMPKSLDGDSNE
jgi:hypothetical protein